jgi:hypothetical protein
MKRLLLLVPILISAYAVAQPCTPDPNMHTVGIYPENFPNGKAGVAYSQVFQFKFPADTTVLSVHVVVDSVSLDSIKGWPAGFTYACNEPDCVYDGGANGCVKVTGTPAVADSHQVILYYRAYGMYDTIPVQAPYQDTVQFVVDSVPSGMAEKFHPNRNFSVSQNRPNPFSYSTEISFNIPGPGPVIFCMYDLLGRPISARKIDGLSGENKLAVDRKELKEGMYFYSIQFGNQVITKRMSVRD